MRKLNLYSDDYDETISHVPRKGARGIILHDSKVLLLHYETLNHYVLPGGGIEPGETALEAFHREILEETGYHVDGAKAVLELTEHFKDSIWSHTFFVAHTHGPKNEPVWTEEEKKYTITLHALDPLDALELLSTHVGDDPYSANIMTREFLGLSEAMTHMAGAKIL